MSKTNPITTPTLTGLAVAAMLTITASHSVAETMTRDNGAPIGDNQNSQTAGGAGPVVLQDVHLIQKLQRFDRERIPERVVHARGAGAFGEFVATADLSDITRAAVFKAGAVTPVAVRFSTVIFGSGSPETVRDPRGFAVKFYTTQGNWDLVGNNLPVFFIRDAIKFPDMVHALKPSPVTNQQEPHRVFDFFSHQPEATHMLTRVYSDFGTPQSYRHMDGNSVHAYKFVNAGGDVTYVKFNWKSLQGQKNLTAGQARTVQGNDFSHATRDLYDAIARQEAPKWDLYIQTIKASELGKFAFNPLDATKIWTGVKETRVGSMTLNRNPENIFQNVEQIAMAPSNLVPGIEPSEDRLLQGRLFSYADTQFHRLGANHMQLPVNHPRSVTRNHNQQGAADVATSNSAVNYQPSVIQPDQEDPHARYSALPLAGTTQQAAIAKTLNFQQAGEFYRSLSTQERSNLVDNLSGDLKQIRNPATLITMLAYFTMADQDYGKALVQAVGASQNEVAARAAALKN
jgi:catalase